MPDKRHELFTAALALAWSVAFFAFLGALFVVEAPPGNEATMTLAAGALLTIVSGATGYYFGSSAGSAKKDQTIAEQIAASEKRTQA